MQKYFLLAVLIFVLPFSVLTADDPGKVIIPPLSEKVIEAMKEGVPAGKWQAESPEPQDFDALRKKAEDKEKDGDAAEALTLWERVLDRSTCTEKERSAVRGKIHELRPKVQAVNTAPEKAKKWYILALVYKQLDCDVKIDDSKTEHIRKTINKGDLERISSELGGFRDLVFQWSSGLLLPEFSVYIVQEPVEKTKKRGEFPVSYREAAVKYRESVQKSGKKYDTVIAFAKCGGDEGPGLNVPFAAAIYGSIGEMDDAAYMMVPWADHYPFTNRGEMNGEMELHEWLHQIDDVVSHNLGYPRGTARSPDDGRGVNDKRTDGETEYRKPDDVRTWCYFYKHIMQEHLTRQIWSEMTTNKKIPDEQKPGKRIQIKEQ
ncbi:MAG: hypothetical protein LBN39_03210 [Planctomycetaceae bacterium]|jgi:hypothetical protein|nr:hypothetical protein [Planctomycetaceae bacterium]